MSGANSVLPSGADPNFMKGADLAVFTLTTSPLTVVLNSRNSMGSSLNHDVFAHHRNRVVFHRTWRPGVVAVLRVVGGLQRGCGKEKQEYEVVHSGHSLAV
jgi:hypothetical protein